MSSPRRMYEKISASRWGCVGKPVPGATRSSLRTRRDPYCSYLGSYHDAKLKLCFVSSQPWFAVPRVEDGRYVMLAWERVFDIFVVTDLIAEVVLVRAALVMYSSEISLVFVFVCAVRMVWCSLLRKCFMTNAIQIVVIVYSNFLESEICSIGKKRIYLYL